MSDDSAEQTDRDWETIGRMAAAVVAVAALVVGLLAFAAVGWGALAAILFTVGLLVGAGGPPMAILLLRDSLPNILATGLAIAGQIAFGRALLARRDDGTYEWTVLRRDDSTGYWGRLSDGRIVDVEADRGELFSFGFGRLAVAEQKTDRNMDDWTVVDTPGTSEQPIEQRAGVPVTAPRKERTDSWLVSLTTIQRAIRGSASSTLIRRGRDKALDEEGGTQQLSQLWIMGFASMLLVLGFVLGYGAMLL